MVGEESAPEGGSRGAPLPGKPMSLTRELEAELAAGPAPTEETTDSGAVDLTGVVLDDLAVECLLGEGGMGQVWKARDVGLDIPVALKILPPHLAADPDYVARFLREARAVARLDHPNIVRIFQAGRREYRGRFLRVIVMEYVQGRDAQALLRNSGKLDPRRASEIALGAARALRYAHGKGVIHRDVKPANLLVLDDAQGAAVKVLDFGLAALRAASPESVRLTQTSAIMGSPAYMSPEQAGGKAVDARSDVYSLGISLFELLAGHPPYSGDTLFTLMKAHIEQPLSFPTNFAGIPPLFRELIEGMCAKSPDDRTPLRVVIERLEQYLGISRPGTTTPSGPQLQQVRTNLTATATSFVGRDRDLQQLAERIKEGSRLTTVMGPGGMGKTRFTREYGLSVVDEYEGGVWFCDLTEARTAAGICEGVAKAMDIPLTQTDQVAQVHNALRMRGQMLMILDNFEQVTEHARETLGVWMRDTPLVCFVASSREPLHLDGERTFPLQPLDVDSTESDAAVRLFVDRARDARAGFVLDDSNRKAIQGIVRELDGIPLAIELAAARVSALAPQKILERLPKRFELLTSRRRDASARQQTLRNTIEWSWNLLQPFERLALAQCSVFRDGFLLEAVEAVLDLSAFADAPMSIDVIESLMEKSLLRAHDVPQLAGEMRYRMYESIREFADWKMMDPAAVIAGGMPCTGPDGAKLLRRRHARHYVEYARNWASRVDSPDELEALNRLGPEVENLFAVQDGMEAIDAALSAQAILAVNTVLATRGPWLPRIPRIERALAAVADTDPGLRVKLLTELARAHLQCGTREGMLKFSVIAVESSALLDARPESRNLQAHALVVRARVHVISGEYEVAHEVLAQAERLFRDLAVGQGIAACIKARGQLHWIKGEYDLASACFTEGEALCRELGDSIGLAENLGLRGIWHAVQGEYDAALECYAASESIMQAFGDKASLAVNCGNRGLLHWNRGEHDAAMACSAKAEAIHRELGNHVNVAVMVGNQAFVRSSRGEYEAALAGFSQAEALAREVGLRAGIAIAIAGRGTCLHRMGQLPQALTALQQGLAMYDELGQQRTRAYFEFQAALAKVHHELATEPGNAEHARHAATVARQAEELARALKLTSAHPSCNVREAVARMDHVLSSERARS